MSESIEIVTSFPLPPKVFYESLTEEEIILMEPPQFPSIEKLSVFGSDQVNFHFNFCYIIIKI